MQIAAAFLPDTANSRYRAVLPLGDMQRRGHKVSWEIGRNLAQAQGTPPWDVLHLHGFHGEQELATVQRLRERGTAVVWDTDDDQWDIPKHASMLRGRKARRDREDRLRRAIAIARAAHLITTPSAVLAEQYRAEGVEHAMVLENYLPAEQIGLQRRRHSGIVIGCTAGAEHWADLQELKIPQTLERLMRAHPSVRVVSIGVSMGIEDPRHVNRRKVPIGDLIPTETEFDIGIAPIVDRRFNRCRSNVKLKEYAAAGAAWLASPVGPYAGMGEAQGGMLVADGDWYEALDALVRDADRRRELAKRAQAWAKKQSIAQAGKAWEIAFRDTIVRARREVAAA